MNNGPKILVGVLPTPLADLVAAGKRAPPPQSIEACKPTPASYMPGHYHDISEGIMERLAYGIPVKKWLDILGAARTMVAVAKKKCGGDGEGCRYTSGKRRSGSKCSLCPMTPLRELRKVME